MIRPRSKCEESHFVDGIGDYMILSLAYVQVRAVCVCVCVCLKQCTIQLCSRLHSLDGN